MQYDFAISPGAYEVVSELQHAGFETYIVGGAIRDLLLDKKPKDFDISTSATPEEVRHIFGRRKARIIGKRFRLTHVTLAGELFEVSTFRKMPSVLAGDHGEEKFQKLPENLIVSDNSYGTAKEDAFRRDFTVNALFYDPVSRELIDHTGLGLKDIEDRVVRAIGEPALRFEEDPVRMLRALKLVAQFDFSLDSATENALFNALPLLQHASPGRLSLELEKILKSTCSDRHFEVFFDYGLLTYFLPELAKAWGAIPCRRALDLLYERNCRVDAGIYRDSISLALAAVALPFAADKLGCESGKVWKKRDENVENILNEAVNTVFAPQNLMIKVREAAMRIMLMQSLLEQADENTIPQLMRHKSYAHARELLLIRNLASQTDITELAAKFPQGHDPREFHLHTGNFQNKPKKSRNRKNFRKPFYKKRGKRPETPPDFNE